MLKIESVTPYWEEGRLLVDYTFHDKPGAIEVAEEDLIEIVESRKLNHITDDIFDPDEPHGHRQEERVVDSEEYMRDHIEAVIQIHLEHVIRN